MDIRRSLVSSGEHVGALRRLGETYSTEEYLVAVEAARDAGDGDRYADAVLGTDVDDLLLGVESDDEGDAVVRAAEASLRRRGVDPAKASYREYAAALVEASA
jgi:hypothetical protein